MSLARRITTARPRKGLEIVLVAGGGLALATAASWPLVLHMATSFPALGFGDPYLFSWQIAWDGYALVRQPLDLVDANTFWPSSIDLAFLDAFHGFAPLAFIGDGARAAVVRYNVVYLAAGAVVFVGAYLLARELGLGPFGAVASGIAFAYAPWRIDQQTHIHVLSSGGIPLALFLLVRGYRSGRPGVVVGGWLVATWQMSLGFTLGIQFAYLLAVLAVLWFVQWLRSGRPPLPATVIRATVIGVTVYVGYTGLQALPYLEVLARYPEAHRTVEEVRFFSPSFAGLVAASEHNLLWDDVTEPLRQKLNWPTEQTLFPGLTAFVLAWTGARGARMSRRTRFGLIAAAAGLTYLSFGLHSSPLTVPYEMLYRFAPGFDAIRTPGRLMTLATLALALLAGAGIQRLWDARPSATRARRFTAGLLVSVLALVWVEGLGTEPLTSVPPVPAAQENARPPILHLPSSGISDRIYTYWSTQGFPEILNGIGVIDLQVMRELRAAVRGFPDPSSVGYLRTLGAETVIVHLDRIADPSGWLERAGPRSDALGLEHRVVGDAIVYEL